MTRFSALRSQVGNVACVTSMIECQTGRCIVEKCLPSCVRVTNCLVVALKKDIDLIGLDNTGKW